MKSTPARTRKFTPSLFLAASSLGIALLVAGCTAGSDAAPPAAGGASAQDTAPGTGTAAPSPTVAGELAHLRAPELERALGEWSQTQPGSKVTTDAVLRSHIPDAEKWLEGIEVVPTDCGLYGMGGFKDQLDESVMAAVIFPELSGADVTVASYPDLNALVADVSVQQHLDKSCGKYTISGRQQKVAVKLSPVKVGTSAPYSVGTLMATSNEEADTKQVSVRAIDGHVMITATRKFEKDQAEATKTATADVEAVLKTLRDREAKAGATP